MLRVRRHEHAISRGFAKHGGVLPNIINIFSPWKMSGICFVNASRASHSLTSRETPTSRPRAHAERPSGDTHGHTLGTRLPREPRTLSCPSAAVCVTRPYRQTRAPAALAAGPSSWSCAAVLVDRHVEKNGGKKILRAAQVQREARPVHVRRHGHEREKGRRCRPYQSRVCAEAHTSPASFTTLPLPTRHSKSASKSLQSGLCHHVSQLLRRRRRQLQLPRGPG